MADYFSKFLQGVLPEKAEFPPEEAQQLRRFLLDSPWLNEIYKKVVKESPEVTKSGLLSEMLGSGDYDYEKAYEARGSKMFGVDPASGEHHGWSRTPDGEWLKAPDHETAWKEVFYGNTGFSPDTSYASRHPSLSRAQASEFMFRNYPGLLGRQ